MTSKMYFKERLCNPCERGLMRYCLMSICMYLKYIWKTIATECVWELCITLTVMVKWKAVRQIFVLFYFIVSRKVCRLLLEDLILLFKPELVPLICIAG